MAKLRFITTIHETPQASSQGSAVHEHALTPNKKTSIQEDIAWVRTQQAERLFQAGLRERGLALLESALAHAYKSKLPESIYSQVIKSYMKYGYLPEAERTVNLAREKFPKNIKLITQQAKLHLLQEKTQAAIELLKPYHDKNKEDGFLATTLANAHLQNGNPAETIKILKPFYRKTDPDSAVLKILANAYIHTRQKTEFFQVVEKIEDTRARDYLTAKFYYLGNESQKSLSILRPYAIGEKPASRNIRFLFFACTGGIALGENELQECERWKKNPYRDTLSNDFMASSVRMYQEGANPVSRGAKKSASLDRGARVHIREPGPE